MKGPKYPKDFKDLKYIKDFKNPGRPEWSKILEIPEFQSISHEKSKKINWKSFRIVNRSVFMRIDIFWNLLNHIKPSSNIEYNYRFWHWEMCGGQILKIYDSYIYFCFVIVQYTREFNFLSIDTGRRTGTVPLYCSKSGGSSGSAPCILQIIKFIFKNVLGKIGSSKKFQATKSTGQFCNLSPKYVL